MKYELSPAVERTREALQQRLTQRNDTTADLSDWLNILLEDEDGKPYELIADPPRVLSQLSKLPSNAYPAPPEQILFRRAVEMTRKHRGDANITTDVLLLAILKASFTFQHELSLLGVDHEDIEQRIFGDTAPVQATDDDPGPALVVNSMPTHFQAARIIDVNLNRSRESLRILDDYARFIRNDPHMTETIKQLRHDLVQATELLPADLLIAARDTRHDVGTAITTTSEVTRSSPADVAIVNMKRLQESLRSVEEFGKLLSPSFAGLVEGIRYRVYSLEKLFAINVKAQHRLTEARLYLLVGSQGCLHSMEKVVFDAVQGGVDLIQLREKQISDVALLERAKAVRKWTRELGVLFIVNDRPDIALMVEADGVHVGQDDLPVDNVRAMLGTEAIIGVSTHDIEQVKRALDDGADYLGVGPIFPSLTKDFSTFPGLDFLREACRTTNVPLFALGGIAVNNLGDVLAAGGSRVAVASTITRSDEPKAVAMQLSYLLRNSAIPSE